VHAPCEPDTLTTRQAAKSRRKPTARWLAQVSEGKRPRCPVAEPAGPRTRARRSRAGHALTFGSIPMTATSAATPIDNPLMIDPTPAEVRQFIAAGLDCTTLEVEGDGRHFFATIVSREFEGLSRVRRHQRVYAALGDRMRAQIHALSMKTLTPGEFIARGA
jgi:acid stress-induced BolA-like protein IbaG/YrbA